MRKNLTDEMLDNMLNSYFGREPKAAFSVRSQSEKRSDLYMKKGFILKTAAAFVLIAALGIGVFSAVYNQSEPVQSGDDTPINSTGNSLFIRAYADEQAPDNDTQISAKRFSINEHGIGEYGGVYYSEEDIYFLDDEEGTSLMGEELQAYLDSGESQWNGYDVIKKQDTSFVQYVVHLNIEGENIATYDIENVNGNVLCFSYTDSDYDCSNTENIPFDGDYFVEWSASNRKITDEVFSEIEDCIVTVDTVDRRVEAAEEALQTADDYTKFFGDTITVTAHFKDGSTQTTKMIITLDDVGNYIINYDE